MHTNLEQLTEETLRKMGFLSHVSIVPPEDGEIAVVSIETRDGHALIGQGGRNLHALQHVLRLLARTVLLDAPHFVIDVNQYRQDRRTFLQKLALTVAEHVLADTVSVELKPMNSFERRIIHVELADREGISTESVGQGLERRVVVQPK